MALGVQSLVVEPSSRLSCNINRPVKSKRGRQGGEETCSPAPWLVEIPWKKFEEVCRAA